MQLINDWDVEHKIRGVPVELPGIEYTNGKFSEYETAYYTFKPITGVMDWTFHGFNVKLPQNYVDFLESYYGSGWKKPDPDWVNFGDKVHVMRKVTYYRG